MAYAQNLLGRMRQQIAARRTDDGVQCLDPRPLLRKHAGGHQPVGQRPIHCPAQRDAVERQHVLHQLLRAARLGVGKGNHRRVGSGQHRAAPSSREADAGVAERTLAAQILGQDMKGRAVDRGDQFHGPRALTVNVFGHHQRLSHQR